MNCPSCGRENPAEAGFCPACGAALPPTGETATPAVDRPAPSAGFVGRGQELAELHGALDSALSGRGKLAMLVGEPGIGKTRTAQELASLAEAEGALVLWGRCVDEEGAPPYWPWLQCLRTYVRMTPGTAGAATELRRWRSGRDSARNSG